jgi:hypothetical protein
MALETPTIARRGEVVGELFGNALISPGSWLARGEWGVLVGVLLFARVAVVASLGRRASMFDFFVFPE